MDLNLIKKLVKIVDTSGVTDLEIEENGLKVKIAKKIRNSKQVAVPETIVQAGAVVTPEQAVKTEESVVPVEEKAEETSTLHEIRSPIVGTFYRAPAPDADAYVQVGDTVSQGTVLCFVEALKLMNEVEFDVSV